MSSYKVVIVGDGGIGKTTYVKRLAYGTFEPKYVSTLGVEVHPLSLKTNYGTITFNFWDCAGMEKYGGLREGYYVNANAFLVMYDCANLESKRNVKKWVASTRSLKEYPTVFICGTKCDLSVDSVNNSDILISSKTNKNLYEPLLAVARALTGFPNLVFLE